MPSLRSLLGHREKSKPPDVSQRPETASVDAGLCLSCSQGKFRNLLLKVDPIYETACQTEVELTEEDSSWGFQSPIYLAQIQKNTGCAFCRLVERTLAREEWYGGNPGEIRVAFVLVKLGTFWHPIHTFRKNQILSMSRVSILIREVPDPVAEPQVIERSNFIDQATHKVDREIQITLEPGAHQGQICNMEGENFGAEIHPLMLRGRTISNEIDLQLLKNWLHGCRTNHGFTCISQWNEREGLHTDDLSKFRLIHVKDRILGKVNGPVRFAALSYTWGPPGTKQLTLTRDTMARLSNLGGLADTWEDIPYTIKDAMHLCEKLDIPFLWVDAVCIQQDDPSDLLQFNMMDRLYASAEMTIVAASGKDSWAGLPGIASGSRHVGSCYETVDGLRLGIAQPSFDACLADGAWHTRAWTLQEHMLSNRLFVFTDHQAFFNCNRGLFVEDTVLEYKGAPNLLKMRQSYVRGQRGMGKVSSKEPDCGWPSLFSLTEDYVTRALTYDTDALRAFTGILKSQEKYMPNFFCGLPTRFMDTALLWRSGAHCPEARRPDFPSWSWVGWKFRLMGLMGEKGEAGKRTFSYAGIRTRQDDFPIRSCTDWYQLSADDTIHKIENGGIVESTFWRNPKTPITIPPRRPKPAFVAPTNLAPVERSNLLMFQTEAAHILVQKVENQSGDLAPGNAQFKLVYPDSTSKDDEKSPYMRLRLDITWRNKQPAALEVLRMARLNGYNTAEQNKWGLTRKLSILMVVETDPRGISYRVSSPITIDSSAWARFNPKSRIVYML